MGLFSSFFSMGGVKLAADKMAAQINSARMSFGASNEFNEALVTPGALGIMYGFVFHVAQKARVKDEREVVRMFYQTCVRIFGPSQEELCVSITKEVIDFLEGNKAAHDSAIFLGNIANGREEAEAALLRRNPPMNLQFYLEGYAEGFRL